MPQQQSINELFEALLTPRISPQNNSPVTEQPPQISRPASQGTIRRTRRSADNGTSVQESYTSSQSTLSQPEMSEDDLQKMLDGLVRPIPDAASTTTAPNDAMRKWDDEGFSPQMDDMDEEEVTHDVPPLTPPPMEEIAPEQRKRKISPAQDTSGAHRKRKRAASPSPSRTQPSEKLRKKKKRLVVEEDEDEDDSDLPQYIRSLTPEERAAMGDSSKWVGKNRILHNLNYGHMGKMFQEYDSRMDMREAGLHMSSMAGIDGSGKHPARCVVANSGGGYDDNEDSGDVMMYTGQGKVAAGDQTMARFNLSLKLNMDEKIPVRVVRGPSLKSAFTPASGKYRYDGLYWVVLIDTQEQEGRQVFVFKLVRLPGQESIQTHKIDNFEAPARRSRAKKEITTPKPARKKSKSTTRSATKSKPQRKRRTTTPVTNEELEFDDEDDGEGETPALEAPAVSNTRVQPKDDSLWLEIFGEGEPSSTLSAIPPVCRSRKRIPNQPLWAEPQVPPYTSHSSFAAPQPPRTMSSGGRLKSYKPVQRLDNRVKSTANQGILKAHRVQAHSAIDDANRERLLLRAKTNQLMRRREINNAIQRLKHANNS